MTPDEIAELRAQLDGNKRYGGGYYTNTLYPALAKCLDKIERLQRERDGCIANTKLVVDAWQEQVLATEKERDRYRAALENISRCTHRTVDWDDLSFRQYAEETTRKALEVPHAE